MPRPLRSFEATLLRGLVGLLGILVLLLAALTWWAGFAGTQGLMRAQVRRDLDRLRGDLELRFQQIQRHAEAVATWWAAGELSPDQAEAALDHLVPVFHATVPASALILTSQDGRGLILAEAGQGRVNAAEFRRNGTGIVERYHLSGSKRVQGTWAPLGWNAWTRPWYEAGVNAPPSGVWVAPYRFVIVDRPGLTFVKPVRDASGKLLGVVCVDLPLDALDRDVQRALPIPGSELVLCDGDDRILMRHGGTPGEHVFLGALHQLPHRVFSQLLSYGQAGQDVLRAEGLLALAAELTPAPTLRWRVAVAVPESALLRPLRVPLALSLGLAVLILMVSAARLRAISRRLGQPMQALEQAARALGEGRTLDLPTSEIREIQFGVEALREAAAAREERELLRHQAEEAQRLRSLGLLAGGIAHQVNNDMAVVLGELEGSALSAERVQKALRAARRCAGLATTLVGWTHSRPAALPLELRAWLREVHPTLVSELARPLALHLPPAPVLLVADPVALEAALLQLMVQLRHEGHGDVSLEVEVASPTVRICLAWEGPTLAPELRDLLLGRPFGDLGDGPAGLGCALVAGVVHAHGGSVHFEAREPQGERLVLHFKEAPEGTALPDALPLAPSTLEGQRVLVADDEPELLELMAEILTDGGAQVDTAEHGERAWALWMERGPYDVVVSDQRMPGLTGTELMARIRMEQPTVPFLLVSGFGLEDLRARLQPDPTLRLLAKPFGVQELLETTLELVRDRDGEG